MRFDIGKVLAAWLLCLPLAVSAAWDDDKGCLACHEGIERIADTPVMKELSCTFCHQGNGAESKDVKVAHKGMYANPADFRVAEKTCGTCHAEHLANGKKSLHATMAGMISGTRYGFGA